MKKVLLFWFGIMLMLSSSVYANSWLAEYAVIDNSGRVGAVTGTTTIFSNQQECVNMNNDRCYSVNACGRTVWLTGSQDQEFARYVQLSSKNAIGFRENSYSPRFCVMDAK